MSKSIKMQLYARKKTRADSSLKSSRHVVTPYDTIIIIIVITIIVIKYYTRRGRPGTELRATVRRIFACAPGGVKSGKRRENNRDGLRARVFSATPAGRNA